ncbi:MAG: TRAP transporter small permease subunit [Cyclobacteriaceae bacterium]
MRFDLSSAGSRLRAITDRAEGFLLWIFTVMLLADVLLGILARYVNFQVVFADELGKYLFIWLCLIGISAATKDNQHVRLTFIASRLPVSRKFIRVTSQLLFLAFSLFLLYVSARLTWMHILMDKSVMGFRFPMYFFTAALPVGFALTSIRLIQDIVRILRSLDPAEIIDSNEYTVKEQ